MATWDAAKAAALKILGPDAEVPDVPNNLLSQGDTLQKANDAFDKAREDCEAKLLAVQNVNDSIRNGIKQFLAHIEKSDFKLDAKNPQDQKKIQQARKILVDKINFAIKAYSDDDKMLDEVDKHLVQLGKYSPKGSL